MWPSMIKCKILKSKYKSRIVNFLKYDYLILKHISVKQIIQ